MRRALTLLLAAMVLLSCSAEHESTESQLAAATDPGEPVSILPPDGSVPDWNRSGTTSLFRGADLYGHINGGSEVFLELGFDRLEVQRYLSGEDELSVELYHMTDPAAALGIYLMKCGKETPDSTIDARHTVSELQIHLVRGPVYMTVNNFSGTDGAADALVPFARQLVSKVAPTPEAAGVLAALPEEDLIPGSERILRGQYTVEALYTLGDGDLLRLAETGTTAVAGRYGSREAPVTVIVARYAEPAIAAATFAHLVENLDSYLEPVEQDEHHLVFEDWSGKYGVVTVTGETIEVRVLLSELPTA